MGVVVNDPTSILDLGSSVELLPGPAKDTDNKHVSRSLYGLFRNRLQQSATA